MFKSSDMRAYQPQFAPRPSPVSPAVSADLALDLREKTPARIVLPYPPSVNALYFHQVIQKRGRAPFVKKGPTEEGRKFMADVAAIVAASGQKIMSGRIVVHVWLYRPQKSGDLDNFLKATLDGITGIGWTDDSQVVEIHAYRLESPNNPRVELLFERVKGDAPLFEGAE